MQNDTLVLLAAEGKNVKIELTETLVMITYYNKSKIEDIQEIQRNSIIRARIESKDEFRIYVTNETNPKNEDYFMIYFKPDQKENFEKIAREIGQGFWYEDNSKMSNVVSYDNEEMASKDAEKAAMKGWMPQGTSATDGHINVGRTVARTILTGGIGLAIGGASRTKGKVTITYIRTPEWMTSNNKTSPQHSALPTQSAEDPLQKIRQLKEMLDAGLVSQEEYDKTKAAVLARM
jgi:hypothetical protein